MQGFIFKKRKDIKTSKMPNAQYLLNLYKKTVLNNNMLLLPVFPNKYGVINSFSKNTLNAFGEMLKYNFSCKLKSDFVYNGYIDGAYEYTVELKGNSINSLEIREDLSKGQRIREFEIYAFDKIKYFPVYRGKTVGYRKLCEFGTKLMTSSLKIRITQSTDDIFINDINCY